MSQSFAKFREKFARGAAGAEIFRNLPLTAPLASQAHAVHMYRIIIERFLYGPRSLGGHLRQHVDLKLSRHLRNFGPAPHSPAAPRAARRARSSGPTLVPTPQPRRTHAGSTRWRVFSLLKFMLIGDQQWATCNSAGPRLGCWGLHPGGTHAHEVEQPACAGWLNLNLN